MTISHRVCIAPMLSYTDRHLRYLMRLITRRTLLYTEMVVANVMLQENPNRFFQYDDCEHPVALQLIGENPELLHRATQFAESYHYDEINLNLGCPSPRVSQAGFGVELMRDPVKAIDCFAAMKAAISLPVTAKIRLSPTEKFCYDDLAKFVRQLNAAGCQTVIVHARTTLSGNQAPKKNRKTIPDYEAVYRLKRDFPEMEIVINGGIKTCDEMEMHLQHVDGVMIGVAAIRNPYLFSTVDARFFDDDLIESTREAIVEKYLQYVEIEKQKGTPSRLLLRHLPNLFYGVAGGKRFRLRCATGRSK